MLEIHLLLRFFHVSCEKKHHVRAPERGFKRGWSGRVNEMSKGGFLESFQPLKSFQQFPVEPEPVMQLYRATFQEIGQQFLRCGCQQTCVHQHVKLEGGGVM